MSTMTDDEVKAWVTSRIAFERWLRRVHADRTREKAPTDEDEVYYDAPTCRAAS